jgi:hypothetical protein
MSKSFAAMVAMLLWATSALAQAPTTSGNPPTPIQGGAVGGAPPSGNNNVMIGGLDPAGNVIRPTYDPCQTLPHNYTIVSVTSATVAKITGASGKKTYICAAKINNASAATTETISIYEGTGSSCVTGFTYVLGNTLNILPGESWTSGDGSFAVFPTLTAADDLCFAQTVSGNPLVSGYVVWVQAP